MHILHNNTRHTREESGTALGLVVHSSDPSALLSRVELAVSYPTPKQSLLLRKPQETRAAQS